MIYRIIELELNKIIEQYQLQNVDLQLNPTELEYHGDYATNIALKIAKQLDKSPMEVAEEIVKNLPKLEVVSKIEVVKPGFINFFLNHNFLIKETLGNILSQKEDYGSSVIGKGQKVIVEHTSVNPNKAMHIGNLRNAILGDSVFRLLNKCGYQVEVENYIDDTGVQVADTTTAILYLGKKQPSGQPYDEFCWDIYSEINQLYETNPDLLEKKKEVTKKIEEGNNEIADLAKEVADKIVQCHLVQMAKFGIFYDLLIYESDILKFGFWEQAFEQLKKSPNFILKTLGDQKGCWVLKYAGEGGGDKIFVRGDGTKVYTAKDTAYHLWKFGLLGKDFLYEEWPQNIENKVVWKTSQQGQKKEGFGQADQIVNVIDERQAYPQEMVKLALQNLGFSKEAKNYHHLAYGVVYLSSQTAKELGIDVSHQKTFYAMAGRKGIGVKVSDLLKLLTTKIEDQKEKVKVSKDGVATSLDIAVGAIRHYMLKYSHNSPVVFDYEQALSLYGNSGIYLQYSHARASGILNKAGEFNHTFEKGEDLNSSEIDLIKLLGQWPEIVENAYKTLSISSIADYAFKLSSQFHTFYEASPVLSAQDQVKDFRLTLVSAYKITISSVLFILGIIAPARM